jgi:hypothetical protein
VDGNLQSWMNDGKTDMMDLGSMNEGKKAMGFMRGVTQQVDRYTNSRSYLKVLWLFPLRYFAF